jgi:putative membrane protein
MTKNTARIATTLVAAMALAFGAAAQTPSTTTDAAATKSTAAKLDRADSNFMKDAAKAGNAELEGSKLALSKSTNSQVKTFAQKMIDDHTKAADELKTLATAKGVTLPNDPSLAQKAKLKLLSAMDGTRFDKQYAQTIGVGAHDDAVKLFQKAAASAKDPEVKAFATKTLPTLQHHQMMAKDLKAAADGEKSAKASTP